MPPQEQPKTGQEAPAPARIPDARETALKVLVKVEGSDFRAKDILDEALKRHAYPEEESGLATELVYGTLRQLGRLDYYLGKTCHRPLEALSPWVRNLLRLALYQILELSRVPESAAVDTAVELSKSYGHEGVVKFVNGVLRELCRLKHEDKLPALPLDPVAAMAVSHSHPLWLARRWVETYGFEKARDMMAAGNQAPPLTLRANLGRIRRDELAGRLHQAGYHVEACRYSPYGLRVKGGGDVRRMPGFNEGHFFVQDESSQMLGLLMAPKQGWQIVDACAAPGGKATHLAELTGRGGAVWAFDRKAPALEKLSLSARRLGLPQLRHEVRDAFYPRQEMLGKMDGVLVDAPCSGLGVLRRRVEARWQLKPEAVAQHAERQAGLLAASSRYLKPGGVLVYATCTLAEEENEDVVRRFLKETPGFAFERASQFLSEDLVTSEGFFRTWPGQDNMDGFFAARMRKTGEEG